MIKTVWCDMLTVSKYIAYGVAYFVTMIISVSIIVAIPNYLRFMLFVLFDKYKIYILLFTHVISYSSNNLAITSEDLVYVYCSKIGDGIIKHYYCS